jgi:hypothetical protein
MFSCIRRFAALFLACTVTAPGAQAARAPASPRGVPVLAPAPKTPQNSLDTTDPNVVIPNAQALLPKGTFDVDSVPDTLDLAEMAQRYLVGISKTLLPELPYFHVPPGMVNLHSPTPTSIFTGGAPNWGKIAQAMVMARRMSGFDFNDAQGTLSAQLATTRNMIDPHIGHNLISRGEGAWIVVTGANPENQMTVAVEGLIELYKQNPSPDLQHLIQDMIDYHSKMAVPGSNDDGEPMAHYRLPAPGVNPFTPTSVGVTGYGDPVFIAGKTMRALSSWFFLSHDDRALNTADLLGNFIRHYSGNLFWRIPPSIPYYEGNLEGAFAGHMHMYANALMGLLWQADAELRLDPQNPKAKSLIDFVKKSYTFIRNSHDNASWALGNFGEICTTADMLRLAVKLTELGAGDYNEDIEYWTRNQIAESQIKGAITIASVPGDPLRDRIGEKVIGLFFEDATHPLAIPDVANNGQGSLTLQLVVCGLGNVIHAMYDVWSHIVQIKQNVAQVNLLLNRATPVLDVKSELPYSGLVHVVTRPNIGTIDTLELRIPDGVPAAQVSVLVNGSPRRFLWRANYVRITGIQPSTRYSVKFPLNFRQLGFKQVKNQNQNWTESTYSLSVTGQDYGFHEQSPENQYGGTFRGFTMVSVNHRPAGGIALYNEVARTSLAPLGAADAPGGAPYHNVSRFRAGPVAGDF